MCVVEKEHQEEGVKRKRGPAKSVCPYNKATALQRMRDDILASVRDIEQLLKLGRETHSCPYYSARMTIAPAQVIGHVCLSVVAYMLWYRPEAEFFLCLIDFFSVNMCSLCLLCVQLVVLPYQMLLHEGTRKAAGVQLKDQVGWDFFFKVFICFLFLWRKVSQYELFHFWRDSKFWVTYIYWHAFILFTGGDHRRSSQSQRHTLLYTQRRALWSTGEHTLVLVCVGDNFLSPNTLTCEFSAALPRPLSAQPVCWAL